MSRVTALFAGGNLLATGLRLLAGILTSKAVLPEVLGLYNGIGLVQGYVPFCQAGVSNGLNRELPYLIGKGDENGAKTLAEVAQAWLLLVGGFSVVILLAVAGWHLFHGNYNLAVGWASFTIPVFGVLYGQFYLRILYAAKGHFPKLSAITVIGATASLILVAIVWWFGFLGLCLRGAIVGGIILYLLWLHRPIRTRPRWRFPNLLVLLKTGIPIFLVGQLYAWWPVFNSSMVLAHAGTTGLGLYVIANMAGTSINLLPKALSSVVYPRMSEMYGRAGEIKGLVRLVIVPSLITLGVTVFVVLVSWFVLPPVVAWILPNYIEGTTAAQWAILSSLTIALTPINNIFNVTKKQARYGGAMLIGMASYFVALKILIREGVQLAAFPQAMLIGRVVYTVVCYLLIAHLVWDEASKSEKA